MRNRKVTDQGHTGSGTISFNSGQCGSNIWSGQYCTVRLPAIGQPHSPPHLPPAQSSGQLWSPSSAGEVFILKSGQRKPEDI